jgi:membrane protease YdiL (CAAX protease family)
MAQSEKKTWKENEAPVGRWIAVTVFAIVVGSLIGAVLGVIIKFLPVWGEGSVLAPFEQFFVTVSSFAGIYICFVLGLKWFCKTSMKSFMFGRDRKPDVKNALIAGGLLFAGMLVTTLISAKNISYEHQSIGTVLLNILFCVMFLWIQTSTEEIIFRGIWLRAPYHNDIPVLPKGLLFAAISSLLFMTAHLYNPEIKALSFGIDLILGALSYFISAFMMYVCNLLIGGMEAGLIFHFINNFYCMVISREEVSVLANPTILVDHSKQSTGTQEFFIEMGMYILPLAYLLWYRYRSNRSLN